MRNLADELYIETLSAVARKRPVYDAVLAMLEPGDMLIVWALDRAYRTVKDAVNELEALRSRGIKFCIASSNIDMDTADGRYHFNVMSANAQWEREKLVERTKEGLAAARELGKAIGRPPKLTPVQLFDAHYRISTGAATRKQIADEYNIWPWTLTRALNRSMRELPN